MAGQITVIGAGVVGLCCAIRLAEQGYQVNVLARDLPAETTSAVMGGLWLPPLAEPADQVTRWAQQTLTELTSLAADPATGVRPLAGYLLHTRPVPPPGWAATGEGLVSLQPRADPVPGYPFGYEVTLPIVDAAAYLIYLRQRLDRTGGTLTRLSLPALPRRGLVVNCTGLSARALVPDPQVRPVRGQVVLMSDPGLVRWCRASESSDRLMSVLPRGHDVVVGGTAEDGCWNLTPDLELAKDLVRRARSAVPQLAHARVLGHRVGLRPARPHVRLEVEHCPTDDDARHTLVHCYGHGDSGLTLAWGCAGDVVKLVAQLG